jgi:hypothetical protein
MFKAALTSLAFAFAVSAAPTAGAVVLFDNINATPSSSDGASSAPLGVGPLFASFSTGASPFSLSEFNVLISGDQTGLGSYYVAVYGDNGSTEPGAQLFKSGSFLDNTLFGSPTIANFSFAPLSLAANSRYWISLGSDAGTSLIWWYSLDISGTGVAGEYWRNALNFGPNNCRDCGAYQMQIGSEVPLPAALPLFATGLGVLGLLGWRRKRKHGVALS